MFEPREDRILDRMQALLAAVRSRHLAWALTLAGAMAVMALHVFYAVVILGWGAPLP